MAAPRIVTSLWYEQGADKAAQFYCSIFPDSRVDRITTMPSESPSGPAGSVVVVEFTLLGAAFSAMTAGKHHEFNDAASITIHCETQEEIDRYAAALTEGGQQLDCGWVIDRWGLRWQIVPAVMPDLMADPDRAKAKRVTDAMLAMKKFDLAAIEAAAAAKG